MKHADVLKKPQTKQSRIILLIALFVLFVTLDIALKEYILATKPEATFGFVKIHLVTNAGASFGILQGFGNVLLILAFVALAVIAVLFRTFAEKYQFPAVFIAAGILGNLINRIQYGFVIDFVDLQMWPVFNLADSLLCIGIVWLCVLALREKN
jgi:signal peptidase II